MYTYMIENVYIHTNENYRITRLLIKKYIYNICDSRVAYKLIQLYFYLILITVLYQLFAVGYFMEIVE